ncbi:hypothetical protein SAMN04488522_101328 [Pedobacter caeni]|uniref:Uncharacterized protein n=2 Tax=Pedobacter caeni TaxID=288992 RepID=A0A1M4TVA8_9SPHI|nr:hypothetical protein SAMN04488522_101328 [Pedobacter caeni]
MGDMESIKNEILDYHQMVFDSEESDDEFNKAIKIKLQKLIMDAGDDQTVIYEALLVLAEATGCAADQKIAEEILDHLFGNKYISSAHLEFFYNNVSTARWH